MAERVYAESDWAVRRWDKFNDRLKKPLSFCHFWRTVLLYATLQQLLAPWRVIGRAGQRLRGPVTRLGRVKWFAPLGMLVLVTLALGGGGAIMGADLLISYGLGVALGAVLGFLVLVEPKPSEDLMIRMGAANISFWRGVRHSFWLLIWPIRTVAPPVGRRLLAGAVSVGEPIDAYVNRHKEGLETLGWVALFGAGVVLIGFVIVVLLISAWLITVAMLGTVSVLMVLALRGVPQAAWRGFAAVMGLLWQAAVAAKHGVCPPVTITRRDATKA